MAKKHFTSLISNAFGRFASKSFPKPIQNFINYSYVKLMGLDMSEFNPPSDYSSLNALFIRELIKRRDFNQSKEVVISPCDSKITDLGAIRESKAYQIKGMSYNISNLLSDSYKDMAKEFEGGEYINFYLSPKDYHRYHAPFNMRVLSITHIPGKLYPVNIPFLNKKKNLFIENERVILEVRDDFNHKHFIILVGALNVGKMVVSFEPKIDTNSSNLTLSKYSYKEPIELKKGELFGYFKMGSTIVILSEPNSIEYDVTINDSVKFAQSIGVLKGD